MQIANIMLGLLLIVSSAFSAVNEDESNEEISLGEIEDESIEDEFRRRFIGGPWTPEDTLSILNRAIDALTRTDFSPKRTRRFEAEANALLELLTGEESPHVDESESRATKDDDDFVDEPLDVGGHIPSDTTIRRILDMHDGTNGQARRTTSSIASLYHWFQPYMIARFRARLEQGGSRKQRLKVIDKEVMRRFTEAREKRQPVHGRMIQKWARQISSQIGLGLDQFKASDSWLLLFKRRRGIVSRKVTVYISRPEQENAETIAQRIMNFHPEYRRESLSFQQSNIWNFDQTGFNYEPANLRTLSFKGERDTIVMIDSKNKHSHSYTVQPMISRDGRLYSKVLIVTQEDEGKFGPRVQPKILELERKYGNVQIYPSKSGKLSSNLIERWFDSTLRSAISRVRAGNAADDPDQPAVLILVDAWSGHSKASQEATLNQIGAKMLKIPKQTTDRLQPLDVNFNRQLKIFYNRIMEEAFYQDVLQESTTREGIINIQSLIHNQLSSPEYRDMIRYAWRNTDPAFSRNELTNFPPKMVNKIQFEFDGAAKCEVQGCSNDAFVKCSHCGKHLCLKHFLERVCFHN